MLKLLFWGAFWCGLAAVVMGYSTGAPGDQNPSICTTMTPQHGANPQGTSSPYAVTFSPANFTAGGTPVSVTLSGGTFKGFLLRAEYSNNSAEFAGSFNIPAGTQKTCGSTLVTHTDGSSKSSLVLLWTPPANPKGDIRFRATFVQAKPTFWVAVMPASVLTYTVPTTTTLAPDVTTTRTSAVPTTVAPVTTTTLAPGVPTTRIPTAAPTTVASAGTFVKDAGCGKSKGCFSDCTTSSCKYLLTWEEVPGNNAVVKITMKGSVGSETSRYIAFGLSTDNKMSSDSVIYCLGEGIDSVYASWNLPNGKSNTLLSDPKSGLSNISVQRVDGILTCTFTRLKAAATVSPGQRYALDSLYTIFWATGYGSASGISKHDRSPVISARTAALTDFSASVSSAALVATNGSLLLMAWIFAVSTGTVRL